jgi:HPt (histidine-containing phosphotransfer) domain-containing protein
MKGDRERCLAGGFDGYVPKPVRAQELFDAIESLVGCESAAPSCSNCETSVMESILDKSVAFSRVDGDMALLREIVGLFLEDSPKLMQEIRTAVQQRDAAKLRRAAHTLKGSVGNFGAASAVEAALSLEMMGKSGVLHDLDTAFRRLEEVMAKVEPAIAALAAEGAGRV